MGLETANFISELVPTNPVTATDPVAEGSNHLRLVKEVLQNTFPGYDKPLTVSPDDLNNAAIQNQAATISGAWRWSASLRMNNNTAIVGYNAADDATVLMLSRRADDSVRLGDTNEQVVVESNVAPDWSNGVVRRKWLGADVNETISGEWSINGSWTFTKTIFFNGSGALYRTRFETSDPAGAVDLSFTRNGELRGVMGVNTDGHMTIDCRGPGHGFSLLSSGTPILTKLPDSQLLQGLENGQVVFQTASRANGSFTVYDRLGVVRKVGYRAPAWRSQTSDHSVSQDDEGTILNTSTTNLNYTINQLEAFSTLRIVNRSNGPLNLLEGAGVSLNAVTGGAVLTGNLVVATQSVVELSWRSTTSVYVFGNGITEAP